MDFFTKQKISIYVFIACSLMKGIAERRKNLVIDDAINLNLMIMDPRFN